MSVFATHTRWHVLRRYLRSPKGTVLWVLVLLAALAVPRAGVERALPALVLALGTAALVDLVWERLAQRRWLFPSSGVLTGLFVALVISPTEPWPALVGAVLLAIASKHLLRGRRWHLWNPAAFGLLVVAVLFGSAESWWGALPDLPPIFLLVLLLTGALVTEKVNKFPQVLAFLATCYGLFTLASFVGDPATVVEAFRPPYVQAILFFACFMVTDPPTSPARYGDQVLYGCLVAALSVGIQEAWHPQYFLLAGLLLGNLGFAWWRHLPAPRRLVSAQH